MKTVTKLVTYHIQSLYNDRWMDVPPYVSIYVDNARMFLAQWRKDAPTKAFRIIKRTVIEQTYD